MPKDIQQRNEIWDALSEIFGEATTRTNKALRGKVVSSLAEAGASRDEIFKRAQAWPAHFPGATFTQTALEKWWDQLGGPVLRGDPERVARTLRNSEIRRRLDEPE